MSDSIINIEHLNKTFEVDKTKMEILRDINLKISPGEFVTIVGHSGCGKSTLLKIICGLVSYEDGKVERSGKPVSGPGPSCGMVFQEHRLLPWLKIKDNISFGLKLSKEEKDKRVGHYLEMVGLKDFANSYPAQLSGGMSQHQHHSFQGLLTYAYFWSSTEKDSNNAYYRYLYFDLPDFPFNFSDKDTPGFSVRCVKKK